jgi:hypothetical protein
MDSLAHVMVGGDLPEQSGQLSGSQPAHQIHLKEAFLRMHESRRECSVAPVAGAYGHNADVIASDLHGRSEPCQRALSVELRQARAQYKPQRHDDDANDTPEE